MLSLKNRRWIDSERVRLAINSDLKGLRFSLSFIIVVSIIIIAITCTAFACVYTEYMHIEVNQLRYMQKGKFNNNNSFQIERPYTLPWLQL